MRYEYKPYNSENYATMLRCNRDSKGLIWDNSKGKTVLVIQCAYGTYPYDLMDHICIRLSQIEIQEDSYEEVLPNIWVRFVTPGQKVKNKGCPLHGEASSYTVFCCEEIGGLCQIYAPMNEKRSSVDIPMEIPITIRPKVVIQRRGFFSFGKTEAVPTGFYQVDLPKSCAMGYRDGDIYYAVNEKLLIPIMKKMMEQGSIYIKSATVPVLKTNNKGLKLLIND